MPTMTNEHLNSILKECMTLLVKQAIIGAVGDTAKAATVMGVKCARMSAESRLHRFTGEGTPISAEQKEHCATARAYETQFLSGLSMADMQQYASDVLGETPISKELLKDVYFDLRQHNRPSAPPLADAVDEAVKMGTVTRLFPTQSR